MKNQNNKVCDINDKPYGRKGIEEMLERMEELDDSKLQTKENDKSIA